MTTRSLEIRVLYANLVKALTHDAAVVKGNVLLSTHCDKELAELLIIVVRTCCQFLIVLLGTHSVFHTLGSVSPPSAAKDTHIAEQFGMINGRVERIEATHRQSCHGTMVGISLHAVILFHHGNAFLKHFFFKVTAIGITHGYDKFFGLALGNQVLENNICATLQSPATLIFTTTVQNVKYGIFSVCLFLIRGGQVDKDPAPSTACFAVIATHGSLAMGYVSGFESGVIVVGNFDARSHTAAAIESFRGGIAYLNAIHIHEIIVDAAHQRVSCGCPYPFGIFAHGILFAANIDNDLLCLWSTELKNATMISRDLRILRASYIRYGHCVLRT